VSDPQIGYGPPAPVDNVESLVFAIAKAVDRIENEPNQFDEPSWAWTWWQSVAEELSGLVTELDAHLRAQGPLPATWRRDPLEGASYCPDCGTWLDYPSHREDCPYREEED
jgi:hypothetical protein